MCSLLEYYIALSSLLLTLSSLPFHAFLTILKGYLIMYVPHRHGSEEAAINMNRISTNTTLSRFKIDCINSIYCYHNFCKLLFTKHITHHTTFEITYLNINHSIYDEIIRITNHSTYFHS